MQLLKDLDIRAAMRDHSRMSASDHLGQQFGETDSTDAFPRYSTQQLQQMAFRVTPKHEWHNWAATSADAEDHDPGTLRSLLHEQMAEYGVSQARPGRHAVIMIIR